MFNAEIENMHVWDYLARSFPNGPPADFNLRTWLQDNSITIPRLAPIITNADRDAAIEEGGEEEFHRLRSRRSDHLDPFIPYYTPYDANAPFDDNAVDVFVENLNTKEKSEKRIKRNNWLRKMLKKRKTTHKDLSSSSRKTVKHKHKTRLQRKRVTITGAENRRKDTKKRKQNKTI